jgi:murein DD-endopeptidase MepM/ murein hydrolase activator NlpD
MKSKADHNRITLLVVRDAGRPVRQLQISKPLALAIPAVAALSLSSLVTSMHFHASQSISQLEAEAAALSLTNLRIEMKVADKDKDLLQLRSQVSELSEEADSIKDKLKSVNALEQELQALINKSKGTETKTTESKTSDSTTGEISFMSTTEETSASTSLPTVSSRSGVITAALNHPVTPQVGGEYIAVYQSDSLQLVEETKDDFDEIHRMIDQMVESISQTITQAEDANNVQANLLAQKAQAEKARLNAAVLWPTESKVITSNFGYRSDPFKGLSAFHSGIDIAGNLGDPVYAALDGEVTTAEEMGARGKYIVIKHSNGLETWYMHLKGMIVSSGDNVSKGQQIGLLGNTGRSTGPHLHFQVVKQNKTVNPLTYVTP